MRQVEEAVRQWLKDSLGEAISVDAKSLRGSRRELPALSMVVAAGQKVQLVLAQEEVKGENVIEAALRLIQGLPLEGRVVTLDAGLNQREIADAIVKKGAYLKDNHARLWEILLQDLLAGSTTRQRGVSASGAKWGYD